MGLLRWCLLSLAFYSVLQMKSAGAISLCGIVLGAGTSLWVMMTEPRTDHSFQQLWVWLFSAEETLLILIYVLQRNIVGRSLTEQRHSR